MNLRIGNGYDVHRLVTDRPLIVGGVTIPYERGLEGHSDADVLLHAIMDAMLGAAGSRDIGWHFPPGDSNFKNISSLVLLSRTKEILQKKGWSLVNLDSIIIGEQPKFSPFIPEMQKTIAQTLDCPVSSVGIKATTTEGLGAIGRGEGLAASATVLLKETGSLS